MPIVGTEFSGTTIPSGWSAAPWSTGGAVTISGGVAIVDGALLSTNTYFGPGHSLEFVATFGANTSEHVGLGTDLNAPPWAIFSTGYPGGTTLKARTNNGSSYIDTDLGSAYMGSPHRYRIDWTSTGVNYYVDGVQVASHAIAITANMRPVASDLAGGPTLSVDWVHMSPYANTSVFASRVIDAGANVAWLTLTSTTTLPTGTAVSYATRTSSDGVTWSSWAAVSSNGSITSPAGRYIQYQASLSTTDVTISPVIAQVVVSY